MTALDFIKSHYDQERIKEVDSDFLKFEEDLALKEDLELIASMLKKRTEPLATNPNNSIILYVTALTNIFDFEKARSNTIGGSPPDIDLDFDAAERHKAVEWAINHWGRERVANIITHGSLKPKSLARKYYKVTEGNPIHMKEVLDMIPEPHHGKEATFNEVVEGNPEKNYPANPAFKTKKYEGFYNAATKLEDLPSQFGIHAGGIVISDFPIWDLIPLWAKTDTEPDENGINRKVQRWVTQFDMHEVEELGLTN